jgi:hypothetical protein
MFSDVLRRMVRISLVLNLLLLVGVGLSVPSCATPYESAKLSQGAASRAIATTALAWVDYDRQHQLDIVKNARSRTEGLMKLTEYRLRVQVPVQKMLHTTQDALDALDSALSASDAGKRKDWGTVLANVWRAAADLATVLKRYGVPIPLPSLAPLGSK